MGGFYVYVHLLYTKQNGKNCEFDRNPNALWSQVTPLCCTQVLILKNFVGDQAGYFVGVKKPQEHLPDLILCDIVMPELDGYGVLSSLRQNRVTAMIPFIFLTAKSTTGEVRTGMKLGADDYLTKPTTAEELLGAIATQHHRTCRNLLLRPHSTPAR